MQIISPHRPPDKYWHLKSVIKKKPFGTSLLYFLSFVFFFFFPPLWLHFFIVVFNYSIPPSPPIGHIPAHFDRPIYRQMIENISIIKYLSF